MKPRILVWTGLALLLVGGGGWYAWNHRVRSELRVQTAPVTSGPVIRRVIVAGTLQPLKLVDIGSQVSGMIKSLEVDFNSIVKKGQIVAHIDPQLFQAALANAQAMYEKSVADLGVSQAALEDANQKLTRAKALAEKRLLAQSDLDTAVIAVKSAQADVESAQAAVTRAKGQVEQARTNLDHTVITSPVDGIIVNRAVEVGQTVAASYQAPVLFTIATNLDVMQVQALVDEADVGAVQEGQDVSFQVESYPDETFTGRVAQVRLQPTTANGTPITTTTNPITGATVSTATNGITYTTIITVSNADHRLRPGMTATVVLTGSSRENVTRIPNIALLFRPSVDLLKATGQEASLSARPPSMVEDAEAMEQVWTFDGKHFTPVPVVLGLSDAQYVEESRGSLKPGDLVVTNATYGPPPKAVTAPVGSPFAPQRGRGPRRFGR